MMRARLFTTREFTGAHMIAVMLVFFSVVVGVNLVLAVMANRSWSGLIVKNSYVASQHFNETVAGFRAQEALGWKSDLALDADSLTFRLSTTNDGIVRADAVAITFRRPSYEAEDHTVTLQKGGDGSFVAHHHLADGLWVASVEASVGGGKPWLDSFRLIVRDGRRIR